MNPFTPKVIRALCERLDTPMSGEKLDEALITFGGKAYPKFGQIVIMAGGAGSGKGFVLSKLVGVEGWTFDVDELKKLATQAPGIVAKVKKELDLDLSKLDVRTNKYALKDPENVAQLHAIVGDHLKLDDKRKEAVFKSAATADPDRKPNLIFDVTLKSMKQVEKYTKPLIELGYKKENIHIVWVVNDVEIAKVQNAKRSRTVPVKILMQTHEGASLTMKQLVSDSQKLRSYIDGEVVFAFNKVGVDSEVVAGIADKDYTDGDRYIEYKRPDGKVVTVDRTKHVGFFVTKANYVYIKRKGKPVDTAKLDKDLTAKISSYVPVDAKWDA
jgi:hypothetical protein